MRTWNAQDDTRKRRSHQYWPKSVLVLQRGQIHQMYCSKVHTKYVLVVWMKFPINNADIVLESMQCMTFYLWHKFTRDITLLFTFYFLQRAFFDSVDRARKKTTETVYKSKSVFEAAQGELPIRSQYGYSINEAKLMPSRRISLYFCDDKMNKKQWIYCKWNANLQRWQWKTVKYTIINNLYPR